MPRPDRLVVVAGTGTEVGKTWVAAQVLGTLRSSGTVVSARKPAQSFDPDDPHPTDAEVLAAATGEPAGEICGDSLSYPIALCPPMAAEALGRPVPTLADLVAACWWRAPAPGIGVVELAGGLRSPQAGDGDGVSVIESLAPDAVLLVADAELGTINSVRLSVSALGPARPVLVVLNRYRKTDPVHRRNRKWLADRDGFTVATTVEAASAWLTMLTRRG